jgi:hypothetical protein
VHAAKVTGTEPGRVLAAYVPGGLERSFEEFAKLRTEQGRGRTAAETNEKLAEINERYDSEFVGPPL